MLTIQVMCSPTKKSAPTCGRTSSGTARTRDSAFLPAEAVTIHGGAMHYGSVSWTVATTYFGYRILGSGRKCQ